MCHENHLSVFRFFSDSLVTQFGSKVYDIALGLEYLHSQNLVHSDLKGVLCTLDCLLGSYF